MDPPIKKFLDPPLRENTLGRQWNDHPVVMLASRFPVAVTGKLREERDRLESLGLLDSANKPV